MTTDCELLRETSNSRGQHGLPSRNSRSNGKLCPRCKAKVKWKTSPYCRECTQEHNREYYRDHQAYYLEKSRRSNPVTRVNQRKRKQRLVDLKGGKCERCGYDRNFAALVFHHPSGYPEGGRNNNRRLEVPTYKEFDISKVILLCKNCHTEVHHPSLQTLKVNP